MTSLFRDRFGTVDTWRFIDSPGSESGNALCGTEKKTPDAVERMRAHRQVQSKYRRQIRKCQSICKTKTLAKEGFRFESS